VTLDPDDPRPPYVQVANTLRAAILTKALSPGEQLPSGADLAARYSVSRQTVQNALKILRSEGLIVSRQGSGVFVRERTERPIGLRPHIERAFERPSVSIDFAGFSGETLHGAIQEPLDKIRAGRLTPDTVSIRMLLPNMNRPLAIPVRARDGNDDPAVRERARQISQRHVTAIVDAVDKLAKSGLVKRATAQVRIYNTTPMFKVYLLNGEDVFFGFYPATEHAVTIDGDERAIVDVLGKDALLFHHSTNDDDTSTGSLYVAEARRWFDSVWTTIAREHAP
jgi:DNA-binding transcriptional regulator YhcF (GntR family)